MLLKHATLAAALGACVGLAACGGNDRPSASGGTASGVPGSTPASIETHAAAVLSDANVFALLDTTYAGMLETERLAQGKAAGRQVRAFANRATSEHALARQQIAALAEQLRVVPALPDHDGDLADRYDMLTEHRETIKDLRLRSGRDFDQAFVVHAVATRKALIRVVDDALGTARGEAAQQLLRQLRSTLKTDLERARRLADRIG